jgi:hypothetical protein
VLIVWCWVWSREVWFSGIGRGSFDILVEEIGKLEESKNLWFYTLPAKRFEVILIPRLTPTYLLLIVVVDDMHTVQRKRVIHKLMGY